MMTIKSSNDIPKSYDPTSVEGGIYKFWLDSGFSKVFLKISPKQANTEISPRIHEIQTGTQDRGFATGI